MSLKGPETDKEILNQQKLEAVRQRIARLKQLKALEAKKAELLAQREQAFSQGAEDIHDGSKKITLNK